MTQATALDAGAAPADRSIAVRRNFALAMLFLVGTINFVDRQLLSVLVEPIPDAGLAMVDEGHDCGA